MKLVSKCVSRETGIFPSIPSRYDNLHCPEEIAMYYLTGRVLSIWDNLWLSSDLGLRVMEEFPSSDTEDSYSVVLVNIPLPADDFSQLNGCNAIALHRLSDQIVLEALAYVLEEM